MSQRPTFSESWYRVADLKVKLRSSTQISRQHYRGERWYVVRDPAGNQFHRLSAPAYNFVGLLDGTRTVSEAWDLVGGQLADDAPTQNEVIQILSQLHSANLIESNVTADAAVLLRRHKKMVKRQWQGRLMNILFPRVPIWDCDKFLVTWMPVMRPLLSWFGAILWLAVVFTAVFLLAPEWPRLRSAAGDSIAPGNLPWLWVTFVLIKAIHELGHGFACRRFGGEVHEMGIMLLVLVPAPYVDASSAWSFPSKWARIFVGIGGMVFEIFVAAIAAFVWLYTAPEHLVNQLAYNVMLIASVSTIIFNANPLLRYDGYYILSDLLEIPNLRMKATEYTLGLIKRHVFKVKPHTPLPPPGQRVWLLLFAITSSIYRIFIGVMIILLVYNTVPVLGVLMALGGVATWLIMPIVKTSKYLLIDPELHRKRSRATAWVVAFIALVVYVVGFMDDPFGTYYESKGYVEVGQKQVIYTAAPGTVEEILVHDGQWVKKDQEILRCRDQKLELEMAAVEARLAGLEAKWKLAAAYDRTQQQMLDFHIQAVKAELADMQKTQGELVVKAPQEGELVAPGLKHLKGVYLRRNEEIGMVGTKDKLVVIMSIDPTDSTLPTRVDHATEAEVRFAGAVRKVVRGTFDTELMRVESWELPHPSLGALGGEGAAVDPSDPKGVKLLVPHIQVRVNITNEDDIVPGQKATVRAYLRTESLFWTINRRVRQLIQSQGNSKWM